MDHEKGSVLREEYAKVFREISKDPRYPCQYCKLGGAENDCQRLCSRWSDWFVHTWRRIRVAAGKLEKIELKKVDEKHSIYTIYRRKATKKGTKLREIRRREKNESET